MFNVPLFNANFLKKKKLHIVYILLLFLCLYLLIIPSFYFVCVFQFRPHSLAVLTSANHASFPSCFTMIESLE